MIHRLLDFKLAAENNEYHPPKADNDRNNNGTVPRAIATLNQEGLIQSESDITNTDNEPFALTRQSLTTFFSAKVAHCKACSNWLTASVPYCSCPLVAKILIISVKLGFIVPDLCRFAKH